MCIGNWNKEQCIEIIENHYCIIILTCSLIHWERNHVLKLEERTIHWKYRNQLIYFLERCAEVHWKRKHVLVINI